MKEEPRGFRACLIPITVFIVAGLVGELLFWIVGKWSNYIAIGIVVIICIPLLLFIIGIIRGLLDK